jgi:hypothetical protein
MAFRRCVGGAALLSYVQAGSLPFALPSSSST